MKKLFFFIGLIIISTAVTQAQVEIKAFAGTNFAGSPGHNFDNFKGNAGYQFGGGVLIGDKFYVEPSLQIGKMTSTVSKETSNLEDFELKQNFVRVPVLAGYHLLGHESGPLALRVFAGPAVTLPGKIDKELDIISKDNTSNALWGIEGGLGVDILFLFLEVNYEHSLTDRFIDGAEGKHNSVYVNAGVHFDF